MKLISFCRSSLVRSSSVLVCSLLALTIPTLSLWPSRTEASIKPGPQGNESVVGRWSPPVNLGVVSIHTHLLPNGKVLLWSREQAPGGGDVAGYSQTYVWDPATESLTAFPFNNTTNLFCSGHAYLPDGRLLVTGGHKLFDGRGEPHTNLFDFNTNTWTRGADMNKGRWYPTNCSLGNGELLVVSGSDENGAKNKLPQVWQTNAGGGWRSLTTAQEIDQDLYPWMHLAPTGKVVHTGPNVTTRYLRTSGTGQWTQIAFNKFGFRDTGSSVMYEDGKVLIMGGGPPTNSSETINLNISPAINDADIVRFEPVPVWQYTNGFMASPRRQMNATLLPDGKVLVTGGTSGGGFNNAVGSVLAAEIWDPDTGVWSTGASMQVRRLYHSTAILLPDGRVFSAGGGFPAATGGDSSHFDYEIYSPPYLFRGPRPTITSAPSSVNPNQQFFVGTPDGASITKVTLVRLSSVTHAFNQNQRINHLSFHQTSGGLNVQTPYGGNLCPPGYYMLFAINSSGVPSVARIILVNPATGSNNSISDSRYFVRMQYEDFLNRDPNLTQADRDGLVFWTRQITQCGNDQACRDNKRVDVSHAFWESGDFRARQDVINDGLINANGTYNNFQFIRYCYRIYLRRKPDDSGFNFWLNSLNQDNNHKRIIRAFIGSGDYRGRFHNP